MTSAIWHRWHAAHDKALAVARALRLQEESDGRRKADIQIVPREILISRARQELESLGLR